MDANAGADAAPGTDASVGTDAGPGADAAGDAYLPGCGNGVVDTGEVCDDGNHVSGDGCSADCLSAEVCGNGVADREAGEACDGGDLGGATCLGQGINAPLGVLSCTQSCQLDTSGCCPTWQSEQVDDVDTNGSMTNSEISVALDSAGVAHFAYRHDDLQELRFAWDAGAQVSWEVVDGTGNTGWHPALAFDSQDRPHILYRDANGQTALAVKDAGSWSRELVDAATSTRQGAIAVDSQDRVHVVYFAAGALRYALRSGGSWASHDLQSSDAFEPSLAVDGADEPHVAYLYIPGMDLYLHYAHHRATGWTDEVLEQVGTNISIMPQGDTSIATDSSDHPHIAYQHVSDDALKLATYDGSTWTLELVDPGPAGDDVALGLDSAGFAHIAYRDSSAERLRYVQGTAGGWIFQTPVPGADSRLNITMALGADGLAHIFFLQMSGTTVNHAYLSKCP